jgi:hypothetical protein
MEKILVEVENFASFIDENRFFANSSNEFTVEELKRVEIKKKITNEIKNRNLSSEKFKHFIFLQTKEVTIFGRKGIKIIGIYFESITERTSISEKIEEKSFLSLNIPNNKSYY